MVDASVCSVSSVRCTLAATAIDDVMITNGKCSNDTEWPESKCTLTYLEYTNHHTTTFYFINLQHKIKYDKNGVQIDIRLIC